jgi:hypothetical protein
MEEDLNLFQLEYDLNFFKWKTTSTFCHMEYNLNFFQMEDDLKR